MLIPPRRAQDVAVDEDADELAVDREGKTVDVAVRDVSCGGGFTVCVTRSGHVFSWGTWSHGRLGEKSLAMQRVYWMIISYLLS